MHARDAMAIASVVGRLLAHARHIKATPGFQTPGKHPSRSNYAAFVQAIAVKIRRRHRLNLTLIEELKEAEKILCHPSKS